jgi:hypothetical protein
MDMQRLLEYVRITNPEMTMKKLERELSKSIYASSGLIFTCENSGRKFQGNKIDTPRGTGSDCAEML